MKSKLSKIPLKHLYQHETKLHVLLKFLFLILILVAYFFFISHKYGAGQGFFITALTWSFFVLCTPIADAGFLIDFPSRILLGVKMLHSEIIVWTLAISLNLFSFLLKPEIYKTTHVLSIFKKILSHPFPFWGIILISAIGTFFSVYFGDELMNKIHHTERENYHKHKYNYRFIVMVFILAMSFVLYSFLVSQLGLKDLLHA